MKKPNINRVSAIAVIAVGTKIETVMRVWQLAWKYKSWKLKDFMANPPSDFTIWKVRKVVEVYCD